jgi:hypothetical protein
MLAFQLRLLNMKIGRGNLRWSFSKTDAINMYINININININM